MSVLRKKAKILVLAPSNLGVDNVLISLENFEKKYFQELNDLEAELKEIKKNNYDFEQI